jgi:nucleotide-binding universal stress UspA family protein
MKKIVVPCDFSEQAVNAFRVALDVAELSKGEVHLVNVIELPIMHDTVLMPVLTFEETLLKELQQKVEKQFQKLSSKYGSENVKVKLKVLFGSTAHMILDYITSEKIDLVVMGTHGARGVREYLIGSNAEKFVRRSTVPVLAIKKYVKVSSIRNIVFPNTLDTEMHEDLVMKVKTLQNFFKAKIRIVWINTPTNFTRDTITRKRLADFAKRFMFKDFTIHIYNDPFEETGIINFAHEIKGDMIAMGTHGRKGLVHLLTGSVAEDVLNHVDCPIWTYPIKKG